MVEYLDPEIAGEGQSANNWAPGAWTSAPDAADEEYQPDIEPPHIPDYAALKKHKHYRQYFRPWRRVPFPAWLYHPTLEARIVKSVEEVQKLGPEWSPTPPNVKRIDMTGKSLPVKSDTQRLAETIAASLPAGQRAATIDPNMIAAIVAAVMAALTQSKPADPDPESLMPEDDRITAKDYAERFVKSDGMRQLVEDGPKGSPPVREHNPQDDIERKALLELAEKEGVKVDLRWGNKRIKEALGI